MQMPQFSAAYFMPKHRFEIILNNDREKWGIPENKELNEGERLDLFVKITKKEFPEDTHIGKSRQPDRLIKFIFPNAPNTLMYMASVVKNFEGIPGFALLTKTELHNWQNSNYSKIPGIDPVVETLDGAKKLNQLIQVKTDLYA